ncbi:hypothetical protein ACFWGI_35705 [Streptomyces niveus]|uniref:hypothetical protein n=1 Tax=Streptomyces niveus TaxID=193462 RepID=UPI003662E7EF
MSAFREATIGEYVDWLKSWIAAGNEPTHYYDYPFARWTWLTAVRDFETGGECGAQSVNIIVPPGIRHRNGDLGHNKLYLLDGPVLRGTSVPIFSNPTFATLPGIAEFTTRQQKEDREQSRAREAARLLTELAASRSDIGRHLGRTGRSRAQQSERESPPLHAHEMSPDDAALIRMMAGAHLADDVKVKLPSGKTISGTEMRRWIEAQDT